MIWITIHLVLLVGFGDNNRDYFFPFTKYEYQTIIETKNDTIALTIEEEKYQEAKGIRDYYINRSDLIANMPDSTLLKWRKILADINEYESKNIPNLALVPETIYSIKQNPFADFRYYDISEFIVYCFGPVVLIAYCYFLFLCFKKEKRDKEK